VRPSSFRQPQNEKYGFNKAMVKERKMQQTNIDPAVIPPMILRRALQMMNGLGLPATHYEADGFDYLGVADLEWTDDGNGLDMVRWSVTLNSYGNWVLADAGRWDAYGVLTPSSITTYAALAPALTAIQAARLQAAISDVA
jgi:hypothetical protein